MSAARCTVNPEENRDGSLCGRPGKWMRFLYFGEYCEKSIYCQSCYDRYGPFMHSAVLPHMKWEFHPLC